MAQDCLLLPYSGVDLGLVDKTGRNGSHARERRAGPVGALLEALQLKLTAKSVNQAA